MQGSVQKNTEIALWEMDQPGSRRPKKSGRKRQGDVDIIDLYVDRETDFARTGRSRQVPRSNRAAERVRSDQTIELIGQNDRVSRPARQNNRTRRAVEPVRQNSRAAEPVRHRRRVEKDWDIELIEQERIERPQRRKQAEQSKKRRKAKKRRAYLHRTVAVCSMVLCLLIAYMAIDLVYEYTRKETAEKKNPVSKDIVLEEKGAQGIKTPDILEDFLEVNDFSRPGTELPVVNSIFVHYTANPGTSAQQNRSYFANLAETQERSASAHFIIGYEGEIVQCIPLDEQAYAVMTRNEDSISIECCYLEADGQFTQETYDSLVQLLAWLKQKYHLGSEDILRHYDCGGKKCPIYYVEHEDAWEKLLSDVDTYIAEHGASQL
ncbi:MAG: N-acetylmuramoyl-L-alanine amidase [Lachnospiraceae bacterium]|nr:N-acetylmuramoyl-L-alanine amidase [Lachnospiraceae bacterium]